MYATAVNLLGRPFASLPPERRRLLALLVLAAAFALLPLVMDNDANTDAMANAMSYATLALGLNIVVGFAGLLDLGYAAFFAIGAYYYGIFTSFQVMPLWSDAWAPFAFLGLVQKINQGGPDLVHFTLSFWLALPTAALVTAFFGVLFGAPTLRLRGDYLAIVTLGFGEIVPIVARNVDSVTNGAAGLNGVQAPRILGYSFGVDALPYYYVGMLLVAFLIFVSIRLRDSRIGRAWMAIREDETAASAMGVNLVHFKLLAFAIGAAFAGMTGVYYIAKLQTATPEMFSFSVSSMLLVMVVLGGMGSVWGVVVGACLLQLMQSWFLPESTNVVRAFGEMVGSPWLMSVDLVHWTQMLFGLILVLMMLFRRDGLIPATRAIPALSFEAQHAEVRRGGFVNLDRIPHWESTPGNALEIRGVTVKFGGLTALNNVDLTVPAGGVVAVIGPNGSGKSTLFNAITGLVQAHSGSIKFHGAELLGLAPHEVLERGVARTFQNIRLFPNLTVLENVLIGQHSRLRTGPFAAVFHPPWTKAEEEGARKWALDIIGLFGNRLTPRANQTVSGLSYANRRRVEISRALASKPKILLLDEPTAGMNPNETLELAEQIKSLHEMGLTILLIEHKLDVVTKLADTVVVLDHGDKIAEGRPDEVRRNEEVLTAYLGRAARAALAETGNVA
ncbi:branched-chain amino acid ABC transporter ATP-binding protein/permease [Limobrevibacterium gyesilva]|uniref:Branched-chain amino acid ABC transporter ATP-binding protein/permease n=1 Tax=Limobrevibacterium gyesilva TaxID=2991712 RepID=A0AA42CGN6_9PROT|nr:branched-chain amino acid ABC transporter ATP-binding protein/permease [Limobrevibacterium gyesilva]MCW3474020.1 branched-chain amino acid ABC transporter ATP-binding protein/permease [Limobrevibacterium gyesilva]